MKKSIVSRAKQRDPDAVAVLYQTYVQRIARYIAYRVNDAALVEDLTANVFLSMVERLPNYEERGVPFEAWLYRMAATEVAGHFRRQKRAKTAPPEPPEQFSVDALVQTLIDAKAVQSAFNRLETDDQLILFFRFVEGLPHKDVGKRLGKSPRAIATAQHRALKKLAFYLEGRR